MSKEQAPRQPAAETSIPTLDDVFFGSAKKSHFGAETTPQPVATETPQPAASNTNEVPTADHNESQTTSQTADDGTRETWIKSTVINGRRFTTTLARTQSFEAVIEVPPDVPLTPADITEIRRDTSDQVAELTKATLFKDMIMAAANSTQWHWDVSVDSADNSSLAALDTGRDHTLGSRRETNQATRDPDATETLNAIDADIIDERQVGSNQRPADGSLADTDVMPAVDDNNRRNFSQLLTRKRVMRTVAGLALAGSALWTGHSVNAAAHDHIGRGPQWSDLGTAFKGAAVSKWLDGDK